MSINGYYLSVHFLLCDSVILILEFKKKLKSSITLACFILMKMLLELVLFAHSVCALQLKVKYKKYKHEIRGKYKQGKYKYLQVLLANLHICVFAILLVE